MGACVAGGMYEVGRPQRLSVEEAQVLESQWKDFGELAMNPCLPRQRHIIISSSSTPPTPAVHGRNVPHSPVFAHAHLLCTSCMIVLCCAVLQRGMRPRSSSAAGGATRAR